MQADAFAAKARWIAEKLKTLYVMGGFGAPLNEANKARYTGPNANAYNRKPNRTALIREASADTFAFDCVGLIKGILWGFDGKTGSVYGGATYASNGVPDIDANEMIRRCSGRSEDFTELQVGEAVWKLDHIGIYIGGGLAVECTPAWYDRVQITACNCDRSGYSRRNWTQHGKLPWIDYAKAQPAPEPAPQPAIVEPFVDVPVTAWYARAARWAYEAGVVTGTDATHFSPNVKTTRAQVVQMLYKEHLQTEKQIKALEKRVEALQAQIDTMKKQ